MNIERYYVVPIKIFNFKQNLRRRYRLLCFSLSVDIGPEKPGQCPNAPVITNCWETMEEIESGCFDDDACPGRQKCCADGCTLKCMYPVGSHKVRHYTLVLLCRVQHDMLMDQLFWAQNHILSQNHILVHLLP